MQGDGFPDQPLNLAPGDAARDDSGEIGQVEAPQPPSSACS